MYKSVLNLTTTVRERVCLQEIYRHALEIERSMITAVLQGQIAMPLCCRSCLDRDSTQACSKSRKVEARVHRAEEPDRATAQIEAVELFVSSTILTCHGKALHPQKKKALKDFCLIQNWLQDQSYEVNHHVEAIRASIDRISIVKKQRIGGLKSNSAQKLTPLPNLLAKRYRARSGQNTLPRRPKTAEGIPYDQTLFVRTTSAQWYCESSWLNHSCRQPGVLPVETLSTGHVHTHHTLRSFIGYFTMISATASASPQPIGQAFPSFCGSMSR